MVSDLPRRRERYRNEFSLPTMRAAIGDDLASLNAGKFGKDPATMRFAEPGSRALEVDVAANNIGELLGNDAARAKNRRHRRGEPFVADDSMQSAGNHDDLHRDAEREFAHRLGDVQQTEKSVILSAVVIP